MRPRIAWLVLSVVLLSCARPRAAEPPFGGTPAELREDLDVLRAALLEGHPAIDRFARRSELDSAFAAAEARVREPMTRAAFQVLLSEVTATLRDGHTSVNLPRATQDSLDALALALPLRPVVRGDTLYVWHNYSDLPDRLLVGARLDSINGMSASELVRACARITPRDGANTTHAARLMERPRLLMRELAILQGARSRFELALTARDGGEHRRLTLPGLTYDELMARGRRRYPAMLDRPPVAFDPSRADGVALLRISDFDQDNLQQAGIRLPAFLDQAFAKLRASGARALVLDLRGNRGGTDEFGEKVASHLISRDYTYYASLEMRARSYAFFARTTNARGRKSPPGYARANDHGTFDVVQHPNLGTRHSARDVFGGALVVLIDGGCFSTTSELLSVLAQNTSARFVGEESGGAFEGNCSGPTPTLLLPNSRLRVDIPLVRYAMAVSGPRPRDRGILPDVAVTPSVDALLVGRDPVLEAGLAEARAAAARPER